MFPFFSYDLFLQLSGESSGNVGSDGNKLSGEQLTQLEMRLKEAEEAMERAMEKVR